MRSLLLIAVGISVVPSATGEDFRHLDHYALMISNVDYPGAGPIALEPRYDTILARRMAEAGFHVIFLENADRETMLGAIDALVTRVDHEGGVVFFYFLGHTVTRDDRNLLLPTGIQYGNLKQLYDNAIPLEEIATRLDASASRVNLVAIDSGRRLPHSWVSDDPGVSILWDQPLELHKTIVLLRVLGWMTTNREQFTRILSDYLPLPGKPLRPLLLDIVRAALRFTSQGGRPWFNEPGDESPLYLVGDEETPAPPVGTVEITFFNNDLVVDFRGITYPLEVGERLRLENVPVGNYTMNLRYPDGFEAGIAVTISQGDDAQFGIQHHETESLSR